jgi:hypothetical protein
MSPPVNTKRTQKAKPKSIEKPGDMRLVLPDSLDDIIRDMQFQEPQPSVTASAVLEKQARVIQKQQELLDQLQQGIRPGWFIQCQAKRADGKQCTRNIKKGVDFCMGHSLKCIYGRITDSSGPDSRGPDSRGSDSIGSGESASNRVTNTIVIPCRGTRRSKNQQPSTAITPVTANKLGKRVKKQQMQASNDPTDMEDGLSSDSEDEGLHDAIENIYNEAIILTDIKPRVLTRSTTKSCVKVAGMKAHKQSMAVVQPESADGEPVAAAPKKRGRRRKLPIDPKFGNNDYIIMWPIICEDQRYLTDRYENIYTNDQAHPVFVGVREVSGKINRIIPPKVC